MRENIFVVAPTLPFHDRYSGDLRLFTILKILSKSHDITYLAKDSAGIRSKETERYISDLRDYGIKASVGGPPIKDIFRNNQYKVAIFEFYHIAEHYLPRVKLLQPSCPVIIDTVDVHYLRLHRKYRITNAIDDLRTAEEAKKRELSIYSQADIVLTVTEEDANSIRNDIPNVNVKIVPNIHSLVPPTGVQNRNEIIFVGGFNHPPNIDAVLFFCENILPRIRQRIPEIQFTIVGSNPPEQIKALASDFINVTGYVPSTTPYLQKSYISVAPLRYGAGMKGKIGEAMAHGLPVVTTSIGAEGMGLKDRENIMIGDSPESFSNAVIELMLDQDLYGNIRNNSMDHIKNNFTQERVGMEIDRLIASLNGLSVKKMSLSSKVSFFRNYARDYMKRKVNLHG